MEAERRKVYLKEAIRIGDDLLERMERDRDGAHWKTMRLVHEREAKRVVWKSTESLYSGVAGITLFLIELYRVCGNERYLQTAQSAMTWTERYCERHPTDYWAFYTGRMGVVLTLIELSSVTGDRSYLETAQKMARQCEIFLESAYVPADLLNGVSGTLLALLHLHAATGDDALLELGTRLATWIADRAWYGPAGLCWDRSEQQIRPLCGLAHGTGGIGFALLEMAHYTGNSTYSWVAEQAFRYEQYFYDPEFGNWPDFRKVVDSVANEGTSDAEMTSKLDDLERAQYMNAWCHGAVGVGLSRLRAFELTGKQVYAEEARVALESAMSVAVGGGFVLCHGLAGNAELCLFGHRVFRDDRYLAFVARVADAAIAGRVETGEYRHGYYLPSVAGEDASLFMGIAGIGYFLLRAAQLGTVRSVLLPVLDGNSARVKVGGTRPDCAIASGVARRVAGRGFERTLCLLEHMDHDRSAHELKALTLAGVECNVKIACVEIVEKCMEYVSESARKRVEDVFLLEKRRLGLDEGLRSAARTYVEQHLRRDRARQLSALRERAMMQRTLRRCADIDCMTTRWCWSSPSASDWIGNVEQPEGKFGVVLTRTAHGIVEIAATPLTTAILKIFEEKTQVGKGVAEVVRRFSGILAENEEIEPIVWQQLREVLAAGFLEEADEG